MSKVKTAERPTEELVVVDTVTENPLALTPADRAVAILDRLEEDAGAGFEDVQPSDLALPTFRLLQSLSPELRKTEAEYIKGAQEGWWLDSVTRKLYSDITFVPVKFVTHFIEWNGDSKGGFVKNHGTDRSVLDRCVRDEKTGKDVLPSGNIIATTGTWFGLVISGTEVDPTSPDDPGVVQELCSRSMISMRDTAQRISKRWISDAQSIQLKNRQGNWFRPPMYAMSYLLGSMMTKNDKGSWMLPTVARAGWTLDYPNGESLFDEAQGFSKVANELHTLYSVPAQEEDAASGKPSNSDKGPARRDEPLDDNIPF